MQNGDWVVDDRGTLLRADAVGLRRLLPTQCYKGDLFADVVKNLGFIGLRVRSNRVEISLRSQVVSSVAFASLIYWLADESPSNIIIHDVTKSGIIEFLPRSDQAIASLVALTKVNSFLSRCVESIVEPSGLAKSGAVADLLEIWADGGKAEPERLVHYAKSQLASRFVVVTLTAGELTFAEIGDGLQVPDPEWRRTAIGRPVARQPDADYWAWVAKRQLMTVQSGQPFVSIVDAEIYWPTTGWTKRAYQRILLPCSTANGASVLFSANSAVRVGSGPLLDAA